MIEERRSVRRLLVVTAVVLVLGAAAGVLIACSPGLPSPSDEAAVAAYGLREEQCNLDSGVAHGECVDEAGHTIDSGRCLRAKAVTWQCLCAVQGRMGRACDAEAP